MNIQQINDKIQKIRTILGQFDLLCHNYVLDAVSHFIETPRYLISVIGTKASGKAAVVNAILNEDVLPSLTYKPKAIYHIKSAQKGCHISAQALSGISRELCTVSDVMSFIKKDYDTTVVVETENDFLKQNIEVRTGYDIEAECPIMEYMMSDIVLFCVRATSLFCLDDMRVIHDLKEKAHSKIVICITHLNNVKPNEIPRVAEFVESKRLNFPTIYFSDEPLDITSSSLLPQLGREAILNEIQRLLGNGIDYNQRCAIVTKVLNDLLEDCMNDLAEQKKLLETKKEEKYQAYLSKSNSIQFARLGWDELRVNYEKRKSVCIQTILSELSKMKAKLTDRFQLQILSVSSPKDWWENSFPIALKGDIDNISSAIDQKMQGVMAKDFNWLNHEIQLKFRQVPISHNTPIGDMQFDYTINLSNNSFQNLQKAKYFTMAGGASLTTLLLLSSFPAFAIVSAACGIIGDRFINNTLKQQRESLKIAVRNVVDDVFTNISAMVPSRVSGLYEEIAQGIAEKEKAWNESLNIGEFKCEESSEAENIDGLIQIIHQLKG